MPHSTALIARQPILNRELKVWAYELLYRSSEVGGGWPGGEQATASVLIDAFSGMGLDTLTHDKRAFINFPRGILVSGLIQQLPSERVVIELLEDITPDPEVIEAVQALKALGFMIALDDFIWEPERKPLVELADIIKVELLGRSRRQIAETYRKLCPLRLTLLAEKVEDEEMHAFCMDLGFELFQGYHYGRPTLMQGRRPGANRVATLRLLSRLYDPEARIEELESLLSQDPALSYRLLRLVNSAWTGLPRRVTALREVFLLLGIDDVRRWVAISLMAGSTSEVDEVLTVSLIRAHTCEQIALHLNRPQANRYWTTGLFSNLDAMLGMTLPEALERLPLDAEYHRALLHHEGPMGEVLELALCHEEGRWDTLPATHAGEPLTWDVVQTCWSQALTHCTKALKSVA